MAGNLPAGASITTINGQRCTAVPRSQGSGGNAAASTSTSSTSSTSSTTSTAQAAAQTSPNLSNVPSKGTSKGTVKAPNIQGQANAPPPAAVSTTAAASSSTTSVTSATTDAIPVQATPSTALASTSAQPTELAENEGSALSSSPSAPIPVALSDLHTSSTTSIGAFQTLRETNTAGVAAAAPTFPAKPAESSTTADTSASRLAPAPVVGGVLGSMALVAVVALLFWCLRRRKKNTKRDSLLTPFNPEQRKTFYEIDKESVGPTKRTTKWKAEIGYQGDRLKEVVFGLKSGTIDLCASLKSKVIGIRTSTPSVNLNRGNSQFLDGPIPQHSRTNSEITGNARQPTTKDRFNEWWHGVADGAKFPWQQRRRDKEANADNRPDFSQLLSMNERDLQLLADGRLGSLSDESLDRSLPRLGSMGLDFGSVDPFADPVTAPAERKPATRARASTTNAMANPFADPITHPEPSIPKLQTYIADIRRSRGQSVDATNTLTNAVYRPPSRGIVSRYPSSIAPSLDSYRDTVFSHFSINPKKGKFRSDPFDLERPELWRTPTPSDRTSTRPDSYSDDQNTLRMSRATAFPMPDTRTSSKYSRGTSFFSGWGDPGPDLGPGSGNSSIMGNASSNGSADFSAMQRQLYGSRSSMTSEYSSAGGVGKAM